MKENAIYCGDNLGILKGMDDGCIDLVYIDPPFFTSKQYEVIWGDNAEKRAFDDRWVASGEGRYSKDMNTYLNFMEPRIREIHRVLKPTGSFYLHCDWHADAYLRVLCDQIFGYGNCRRQLIWKYEGPTGTKKNYPKKHDIIWFYTKGNDWTFNYDAILNPFDDASKSRYNKIDENGRRYKEYGGKLLNKDGTRRRAYAPDGKPSEIFEIPFVQNNAAERLGYPTQKPEALLERIIKASSNEGDAVADFFAGCGTSLAVAKRLNRKFVGVDISPTACRLVAKRISYPLGKIIGLPLSTREIEQLTGWEFQNAVIALLDPSGKRVVVGKKGADGGIDGVYKSIAGDIPLQVKKYKAGRKDLDEFASAMRRQKVKKGIYLSLGYSADFEKEKARLRREDGLYIVALDLEAVVSGAHVAIIGEMEGGFRHDFKKRAGLHSWQLLLP